MKYEPTRDIEQRLSIQTFEKISVMPHFHRSIELIYIERGTVSMRIGTETHFFHAGEIAFVPPYFLHAVLNSDDNKITNCIIPHNCYKQFESAGIRLHFVKLDNADVNAEIWDIIKRAKNHLREPSEFFDRGFSEIILALIVKYYEPVNIQTDNNDFITSVIEYIDRRFKENITLDEIAAEFKYSKYYFSRRFNRAFGCGLNHYINRVRYNYVLDNTEKGKNHTVLIMEAGFNDLSTFYKFREGTILR